MIEQVLSDLKREEGFRDRPYRDHLGFLSTGYGFLIDPERSIRMPRDVADLWIERIVEERYLELLNAAPWIVELPEPTQRGLAQMTYVLGVRGTLNFERMMAALQAGDFAAAEQECTDSGWWRDPKTRDRCERVAKLIGGSP